MEDKITMGDTMVTDFSKLVVVNASEDPQDMKMMLLLSDTISWCYVTMGTDLYHEILSNILVMYAQGTDPRHLLILHGSKIEKDWNGPINRFNYVNFIAEAFEIKMLDGDIYNQFNPEGYTNDEQGTEYYTRD